MGKRTYDNLIYYCRTCFIVWPLDPELKKLIQEGSEEICPKCEQMVTALYEESWMASLCKALHTELTEEQKRKRHLATFGNKGGGIQSEEHRAKLGLSNYKHGAYAQKYLLPPAKSGKYSACQSCPFAPNQEEINGKEFPFFNPEGDNSCLNSRFKFCTKNSEILMALINAHNGGGPSAISELVGNIQGFRLINLQQALQQLTQDGLTHESDIIKLDKDGNPVNCGTRLDPHPLLFAVEKLSNNLGIDLAQWNLTPRSAGESVNDDKKANAIEQLMKKFQAPTPEKN